MQLKLPTGSKEEFGEVLKDLHDLLGRKLNGEEGLTKKIIMRAFEVAFWSNTRTGKSYRFSPSRLTSEKHCERRMYFEVAKVDELSFTAPPSDQLQITFDLGTMVHLYIQYNLLKSGELEDFEVWVENKFYNFGGIVDGVNKDYVDEYKSINSYALAKLKKEGKPYDSHIQQASLYADALQKEKIRILYYDKNTSDTTEFWVEPDREFVKRFKKTARKVMGKYSKEFAAKGADLSLHELPEKVCGNRLTEVALECPFADFCFNLKN